MNLPDRRAYCQCGHLLARHHTDGHRPCGVQNCLCSELRRLPTPCCAACGHPASFRSRPLPGGGIGCAASGCTCREWSPDCSTVPPTRPPDLDAIEVRSASRSHRIEFRHPGPGERVTLRITASGQLQVEVDGSIA